MNESRVTNKIRRIAEQYEEKEGKGKWGIVARNCEKGGKK